MQTDLRLAGECQLPDNNFCIASSFFMSLPTAASVCMYICEEKFASHFRPDSRNVVANFNYFQIRFNDLNFCYQCSCEKKS